MEKRSCLLAKRFRDVHGGRLMTVEVYVYAWANRKLKKCIRSEWPMADLVKEASLNFYSYKNLADVGGPRYGPGL